MKIRSVTFPWIFFFPGLFLVMAVLSVNVMGDGLRDALDPHSSAVKARTTK
jgi:peptide/nickel transport system permease protein